MLIAALTALLAAYKVWTPERAKDFDMIVTALDENIGRKLYVQCMTWVLDRIDDLLSRTEKENGQGTLATAWSADLASFNILLAVAYPMLFFVAQWLAGYPLTIGEAELAPSGSNQARIFGVLWLGSALLLYLFCRIFKITVAAAIVCSRHGDLVRWCRDF